MFGNARWQGLYCRRYRPLASSKRMGLHRLSLCYLS
nr:MAG TPA: hypothetical protein [Caudoviricetes sp.]